jgi:hypothetical protein
MACSSCPRSGGLNFGAQFASAAPFYGANQQQQQLPLQLSQFSNNNYNAASFLPSSYNDGYSLAAPQLNQYQHQFAAVAPQYQQQPYGLPAYDLQQSSAFNFNGFQPQQHQQYLPYQQQFQLQQQQPFNNSYFNAAQLNNLGAGAYNSAPYQALNQASNYYDASPCGGAYGGGYGFNQQLPQQQQQFQGLGYGGGGLY